MIPWSQIETIFLDAGNTLVSIDFVRVARELSRAGLPCTAPELRRAEAAARPAISRRVASHSTEAEDGLTFLLRSALAELPSAAAFGEARVAEVAGAVAPGLRVVGQSHRLWCEVMSGVPEALARLRDAGFELVVVSNADGTVARGLSEQGLAGFFSAIHDSHLVGFEKPDPRIFEHALDEAGADPARTLHVGDLFAADVVGARAAGLHALLLDPHDDWGPVDCERLPDLTALAERLLAARADPLR